MKICKYCKKGIYKAHNSQKYHKNCSKKVIRNYKRKYMKEYNKLPKVRKRVSRYWKKRYREDSGYRKKCLNNQKKWKKNNPEKWKELNKKNNSKRYYKQKAFWESLTEEEQLKRMDKRAIELLNTNKLPFKSE